MAKAELHAATMNARHSLRLKLGGATNDLDLLRNTYAGSLEQSRACDELVGRIEKVLETARELAVLAHANAARHHGESSRPGFEGTLRYWKNCR